MKRNISENKHGRTLYDLIAEYFKPVFVLIIFLIIGVLIIIYLRIPFKIGSLEIGVKNQQKEDTFPRTRKDIIYPNQALEVSKLPKSIKVSESKIQKNRSVEILGNGKNTNTETNNGNIGNTTAKNVVNGTNNGINGDVTVNVENKLSEVELTNLYNQVDSYISANGFKKGFYIVREPNDNAPSVYNQIYKLFTGKNYTFLGFENLLFDERTVKRIGVVPLDSKEGIEILIGEF